MRELSGSAPFYCSGTQLQRLGPLGNERKARGGCPAGTLNVFDQPAKSVSFGITEADRRVKNLLGNFNHAFEQRATAG